MLAPIALMLALSLPGHDCTGDDLDTLIRRTLEVRAYSLQPLDLKASGEGLSIGLNLGGRAYVVDLALAPTDAPGCTMILDDGSGHPVEFPVPPPVTYRGTVRGVDGSMASGSVIDGRFTGIIYLSDELSAWNILPLTQVAKAMPAAGGLHVVSRFDDSEGEPWTCGGAVPTTGSGAVGVFRESTAGPGGGGPGGPDASYYCQVAIEADYPYFVSVGGTASTVAQDISTVMANVTSYSILSGTNVRFQIVRYLIRVSSAGNPGLYNVSDPNTLLTGFRTVWGNLAGSIPRDVAHMFTGRDLTGTTIGIAYLSVICSPTSAYGLSASRFSLQPGRRAALTAHELGHNFSAHHCDASATLCTPCWIMLASQGSTTNQLTRYGCSTSIIATYATGRPCLDLHLTGTGCAADWDHDGTLTVADLSAYHLSFTSGDLRADMDGDGRLTAHDPAAFLNAFAVGCS